jgi:hypothetical protein
MPPKKKNGKTVPKESLAVGAVIPGFAANFLKTHSSLSFVL